MQQRLAERLPVMSAANEVAVHKFLRGELAYTKIYEAVAEAINRVGVIQRATLDEILDADSQARIFVNENY